ncbi:MAG: 3-deoxy-manno-octulosonate cytidylyltransferase [Pseudomonadota bacterium]
MKRVIVIPARLASQRLPNKPLADIHGVPMVVRTATQAAQASADRVVVAVDDERVAEVVTEHGFEALLTAATHPSGSDRTMEVAQRLGLEDQDVVVNVQGDEPLLPPQVIDALLDFVGTDTDTEIATVAEPLSSTADFLNPNVVKLVIDDRNRALYFSRAPVPYPRDEMEALDDAGVRGLGALRHVGMYAFRVAALADFVTQGGGRLEQTEKLEQLRWLQSGRSIAVLRWEAPIPGGVDTQADLKMVRDIIARGG